LKLLYTLQCLDNHSYFFHHNLEKKTKNTISQDHCGRNEEIMAP